MKHLLKLSAVIVFASMSPIAMAQDTAADTVSQDSAQIAVETEPMIIAKVNGLVCDFCAQALKKVFKKEAAFKSLVVDLDNGEVKIAVKDGETIDQETVERLIRKSGYSLVSTERVGGA